MDKKNTQPKPFRAQQLREDTVYNDFTERKLFKLERMKEGFAYFFQVKMGGVSELEKRTIDEFCMLIESQCMCPCNQVANEVVKENKKLQPMCREHATKHWINRRM